MRAESPMAAAAEGLRRGTNGPRRRQLCRGGPSCVEIVSACFEVRSLAGSSHVPLARKRSLGACSATAPKWYDARCFVVGRPEEPRERDRDP